MANTKPRSLYIESQTQKLVVLTCLGTLVHWYDFYIFSYIAPHILRPYFSAQADSLPIYSVMAITIGMLVRPIGAFLFGHKIDQSGRKYFFEHSLNLMVVANIILFIFPFKSVEATFGIFVLFSVRVLQGISLSMEYGSASTYIFESVSSKKRGFYLGLLQVTAPIGFAFSYGVYFYFTQLLSPETLHDYGWKFLLLLGFPLVFVSRKIRCELEESPDFIREVSSEDKKRSLKEQLKQIGFKKLMFYVFAFGAPQGVTYYLSHFSLTQHLPEANSHVWVLGVTIFFWPTSLIAGFLSDHFCSKKILNGALILILILLVLGIYSVIPAVVLITLIYILSLFVYGITTRIILEGFEVKDRGVGVSVPYHLGNGVFGGIIALIPMLTLNDSDLNGALIMMSFTALVVFIAIILSHIVRFDSVRS